MKWLVDVGHQMNHVLQCQQALVDGFFRTQDGHLALQGTDNATAFRAVPFLDVLALAPWEVHVMPGGRGGIAVFIGPSGDGCEGGARLQSQKGMDGTCCLGGELNFSLACDELVGVAVPGECGHCRSESHKQRNRRQDSLKERSHASDSGGLSQ